LVDTTPYVSRKRVCRLISCEKDHPMWCSIHKDYHPVVKFGNPFVSGKKKGTYPASCVHTRANVNRGNKTAKRVKQRNEHNKTHNKTHNKEHNKTSEQKARTKLHTKLRNQRTKQNLRERHLQCQRAANAMNDFRYSPNFNSQQWAEQFFKDNPKLDDADVLHIFSGLAVATFDLAGTSVFDEKATLALAVK